jgi:phosphatidylinositol alpha-1,6-mannosyltransferase
MNTKKILIVAPSFPPTIGGVAAYAHQMALGFHSIGMDVRVIAPQQTGYENFDQKTDLHIVRTYPATTEGSRLTAAQQICKAVSLISLVARASRTCRTFKPDVVYLPSMYPFAAFIPYKKGRFVTTFHGAEILIHGHLSRFSTLNNRILKKSCQKSSVILANSHYTAGELQDIIGSTDKIFVTGCGVDWQRFNDVPGKQKAKEQLGLSGRRVLLTVALLSERKGVDVVLRCIGNIRRRFPDLLYLIVGNGVTRPKLESLVDELGLHDCVRFEGSVRDDDIVNYMAACDIFVMPNRKTSRGSVEGFGIVFLEANSCRTPVIGGRSGGAVDAIEHEKTGLLVDPNDDKAVEEAVTRLLDDPQLAAKLGRQGRERVEKYYKWEDVAARTCRHILEQLG